VAVNEVSSGLWVVLVRGSRSSVAWFAKVGMATLGVLVAGLLFAGVQALAAAPETPETRGATGVTATTATLHGVLNPGEAGEAGSYQFSYAVSEAGECSPGTLAPASPVAAAGVEKEAKSVAVTGLEPSREYAFCIIASSLSAEPSQGVALSFKTPPAPPAVDGESVSAGSTDATLEARVNPNNQETTYSFEYGTSSTLADASTVAGASTLTGFGDQPASVTTNAVLVPGTTYYYRVLAKNAANEETKGTVESFTTVATPRTEAATGVTATTALLHGELSPLNATVASEYSFDYNVGAECTGGSATTLASGGTGLGSEAVSSAVSELEPSASYSVCLVSSNAFGFEVGPTSVHFATPPAAPTVVGETAAVTPFEATLEAQVNPNNQETTYYFEYGTSPVLTGAATLKGTSPLSGYGAQTATAAVGHVLTPGMTYYYRAIAENVAHEKEEGTIETFTTPAVTAPVVESESSSGVTPFAVTLEATVNPDYQATRCDFEYGTDPTLVNGTTIVACPASLGEDGGGVGTSVSVSGLSAETTYYFRVVASNVTGAEHGAIERFETTTAEAPAVESESLSGVTAVDAKLEARVNPNYQATTYTFEYASAESVLVAGEGTKVAGGSIPGGGGQLVSSDLDDALAPNTPYFYRVVASNATGTTAGASEEFKTLVAPTVSPGGVLEAMQTTATVTGTVNAEGGEGTTYHVAYVDQAGYEAAIAEDGAEYRRIDPSVNPYAAGGTSSEQEFAAGNSAVEVAGPVQLAELQPGTTYHYALVAADREGTTVIGPDQTLTTTPATPPHVNTGGAEGVSQLSATLTGSVDTEELPTTSQFEFGVAPYAGSVIPAATVSSSGSTTILSVTFNGDLQPGTTYYYRAIASNADGTSTGTEQSFTTASFPATSTLAAAPALIPYSTVAEPTAKEAKEDNPSITKPLTKAQKLTKALKTCKKDKSKSKRAICERRARKKYAPKKKKK
jgi:phosphodiesterase/alkaline phosphatase D-like protein